MKLTIKKITKNQKISKKTNNPYTSIGLLTEEYGDKQWINGFGNKQNEDWKIGDVINVELTQGEYNGNKTLNFSMIDEKENNSNKSDDRIINALREIYTKLQEIEKLIK